MLYGERGREQSGNTEKEEENRVVKIHTKGLRKI